MSWSQMIVYTVLGVLIGAHPKVAPVVGPVTTGLLELVWFLISRGWARLVAFGQKPKPDVAVVEPAAPTASDPAASAVPSAS